MNRNKNSTPIAVIGLGCRYPGSSSPQQLWENVLGRRRQFRRMPDCRLPLADYYDENLKTADKTYARQAAVIDGFEFDWSAHRIPKSTYEATDIVHWLALDTALQAIADAGFKTDQFPGRRTGVIVGNSLTGEQTRSNSMRLRWPFVRKVFLSAAQQCQIPTAEMHRLEGILEKHYKSVFPAVNEDTLAGGLSNTIAGRICNYLNTDGGGYTVDGACSSSLLAVITAAAGLGCGDIDLALAGGVDISLDPFELIGFSKTLALTPDEMAVYDRRGNGFIPGEGCGFVVLKRHEDAVKDGNYIYAMLHGWGISSDGSTAALTAPSVSGQALAINRAYARAGYGIHEVNFIEGHGTGTAVGDRIELEAIAAALNGRSQRNPSLRKCGISSLKSILGHTKAASGIGGFIKAVIGVNRRICPPTAGCRYPSSAFDKAAQDVYAIQRGERHVPNKRLKAGISAMGFGGINCHLTIESADPPDSRLEATIDERALMASAQAEELFVLSGSDSSGLAANCLEMAEFSSGISFAEMTDFAAHLAKQVKSRHRLRTAFTAENPEDLHQKLQQVCLMLNGSKFDPGDVKRDSARDIWVGNPVARPCIGFLFPGQGSQRLGMAQVLVERFEWARDILQLGDNLCEAYQVDPLSRIIYPPLDRARDADQIAAWDRRLSRTANAQPAICLASIIWYRFLRQLGIEPSAVGGHSLGEAVAFYASGAFDESTLLRFAFVRGQAMNQPQSGTMLSLQCDQPRAEALLGKLNGNYATLANINALDQMVISGEVAAIDKVRQLARAEGIGSRLLRVSNAFHSRLMEPAAEKLAQIVSLPSELAGSEMQLFSGLNGRKVTSCHDLPGHFIRQITAQVHFAAMAESMAAACDIMVEVGPGQVLSSLVNSGSKHLQTPCMPVESSPTETRDFNQLLARLFVSGADIKWDSLYTKRLVKPFVPAGRKSYFTNPCEKPVVAQIEDQPVIDVPAPAHGNSPLPDLAGLTQDDFNAYLSRRGAFLAEVIKADLKHSQADIRSDIPYSRTEAQATTEISLPEKMALAKPIGGEHFYSMLENATGFPRDSLTPDLRLLDDLNLDSIKSGDLIAAYAQESGLAGQIDPAELANASIQEIIDLFGRLRTGVTADGIQPVQFDHLDLVQALVQQVARLTGIPAADISADTPVGSQFGLGVGLLQDVLQAVSDQYQLDLNLDLHPLIDLNLNQIADIVARIANTNTSTPAANDADLPHSWVREFKVSLIKRDLEPLPDGFGKRTEDKWSKANVLIMGTDSQDGVCRALGERLIEKGAGVFRMAYNSAGTIDFSGGLGEFSHFVAVLPRSNREALTAGNGNLKTIIDRLACAALPPPAAKSHRRRACLAFIQFGGGFFGTGPHAVDLEQCCSSALAKSVHLERDDLKVRVMDFDSDVHEKEIAAKAVREMQTPAKFVEVGYDRRLTRRTSRVCLIQPIDYRPDDIPWSTEDVILVTGGAKGITAECALAVARATGARVALMGRTPLNDLQKDDSDGDGSTGVLARFESSGLEARYYRCNVCDQDALQETLRRISREMGPITGVIHGAGLNVPRRITQVTPPEAFREVSPKVIGAQNLLSELKHDPPKLMIGLTSVIGVGGMPGNGWYAFSNEALDLILRRFGADHPSTRTLSVAFSIWRDTGMGAKLGSVAALKRKGIDAIPNEEGCNRFVRLFRHDPGPHQVIISARMAPMDTLPMIPARPLEGARFLDRMIRHTPGVESAFAVHLTHDQDLYVKDHCFNGSYLFPTVFGLEAMAQVVAHVTGRTEFGSIRVEDLLLQRPITVDPEDGADIIVYACIQERQETEEPFRIKAGIFKPGVNAKSDCFSATFVLGSSDNAAIHLLGSRQSYLDIRPADLYRHRLLFQGPRFQRIDRVYQLEGQGDRSGTVLLGTTASDSDPGELAFANSENRRLLLGDPFRRDSLLQSAALLIPQDTSLPVFVKRWDIYQLGTQPSSQPRLNIQTSMITNKEQVVRAAVKLVDNTGGLIEKLDGYQLRILQHHEDYPTVGDLLNPDDHDTAQLQEHFARMASEFDLKIPEVRLAFIPGIHDLPKSRRRRHTHPLLEKVVRQALNGEVQKPLQFEIGWHASGQPVVRSSNAVLEISLAHDKRYCLATAADWPVGCDIERVTHRTLKQWVGLLGPVARTLVDEHMDADALNQHCTMLWASKEVIKKMGVQDVQSMTIGKKTDNGIILLCRTETGEITILASVVLLTRGGRRVIAMSALNPSNHGKYSTAQVPVVDYNGYESLVNCPHYLIDGNGPQGQTVFIHRFPVTFQPAGQLGRHVYFSHYFFWAGFVREASAWPVLKRITDQFSTGEWGGVTNYADLKIMGEATTHDLVEVRMWASGNGGPHNSVLDLTYDFRKVIPNGDYERLALLEQQTTWVRIIGNAVVKVEPYPDYYGSFLDDMLPRYDAPNTPQSLPEPMADLRIPPYEPYLYTAPAGPAVEPILHSEFFETTLEDSNIVGNIYFANYYAWQGRVRDRYFYSLAPEYFHGTGEAGELICLDCRIDHLREGMPFDRIEVRMALKALQYSQATLHFEYFKILPDGRFLKLATGEQTVVWVRRDADRKPVRQSFPPAVHQALRESYSQSLFKVASG